MMPESMDFPMSIPASAGLFSGVKRGREDELHLPGVGTSPPAAGPSTPLVSPGGSSSSATATLFGAPAPPAPQRPPGSSGKKGRPCRGCIALANPDKIIELVETLHPLKADPDAFNVRARELQNQFQYATHQRHHPPDAFKRSSDRTCAKTLFLTLTHPVDGRTIDLRWCSFRNAGKVGACQCYVHPACFAGGKDVCRAHSTREPARRCASPKGEGEKAAPRPRHPADLLVALPSPSLSTSSRFSRPGEAEPSEPSPSALALTDRAGAPTSLANALGMLAEAALVTSTDPA